MRPAVLICLCCLLAWPALADANKTPAKEGQDLSPWIYQLGTIQTRTIEYENFKKGRCQTGTLRYHYKKDFWQYCNNKAAWVAWPK